MRVNERSAIVALAAVFTVGFTPSLPADQQIPGLPPAERLAAMQRFSEVIGLPVRSRQDQKFGMLRDLLLDPGTGRILCLLVLPAKERGAFLVAIPAESFPSADQNQAILDAGKGNFQTAPHLDNNVNDAAAVAQVVLEAYDHFNKRPLLAGSLTPSGIVRASKLIGLPARCRTKEELGNLIDLMVDLQTARVVFGVLSIDGSDETRYAVPTPALRMDTEKPGMMINAEKAKIAAVAHKGRMIFKEMVDPAWAAATYALYCPEEGGGGSAPADPTHENVRDKVVAAPAPGMSDEEIRKRILTAIIRDDSANAYSYKQLKILSVNGHVTLQGRAKNQKQKDALRTLAEGVVGTGNVDNQLELRK